MQERGQSRLGEATPGPTESNEFRPLGDSQGRTTQDSSPLYIFCVQSGRGGRWIGGRRRSSLPHAKTGRLEVVCRRTSRAVGLAASMAARPGGRVTEVLETSAEREGAFRLLRNGSVDETELGRSSHRATVARLSPGKEFLVAVDQTGLSVTDAQRN